MQAVVPQLDAQSATVQTIAVGQLNAGPLTVDELVLNNTALTISAGHAMLRGVTIAFTLHFSLTWHVHVDLPFHDLDFGDTRNLGSIPFSIPVGDVTIPGISDVHLNIPSLSVHALTVPVQPIALSLSNAVVEDIHLTNVTVPAAGFTLAGLILGSVRADGITLPAATVEGATIGHLRGDAVQVPTFNLGSLVLPEITVPAITSATPFDVPANPAARQIGFDASVLKVMITVTPTSVVHVNRLEVADTRINTSIGQTVLHNVTIPYDVLNLSLSQLGIDTLEIPALSIS